MGVFIVCLRLSNRIPSQRHQQDSRIGNSMFKGFTRQFNNDWMQSFNIIEEGVQ